MSGKYARSTEIASSRSRIDIERVLQKYGARGFAYATEADRAMIGFRVLDADGTMLAAKVMVPMPDAMDSEFRQTPRGRARSEEAALTLWEQACRSRWRALLLVIKAKLEAVECGISTIQREFLPDVVLGDGRTVIEHVRDQRAALESGGSLRLLEAR